MGAPGHRKVFDGDHLQAHLFAQNGRRLFVSFSHMDPGRTGFPEARPVQRFVAAGLDHLQILTARNDWYMNRDLPGLKAVLPELVAPYRRILSMGFSMGGYAALLLSRPLRLDRVFLVSPQVTPFSDLPPFDGRYRRHTPGIARDLQLGPGDIRAEMQGFVLYDPWHESKDADHARLIEGLSPGLRGVRFPFGGHPAARMLQEAGMWGQLQDLLLNRKSEIADLVALRRAARRGSSQYMTRIAQAVAKRRAAQEAAPASPQMIPDAGPQDSQVASQVVNGFGNSLP